MEKNVIEGKIIKAVERDFTDSNGKVVKYYKTTILLTDNMTVCFQNFYEKVGLGQKVFFVPDVDKYGKLTLYCQLYV